MKVRISGVIIILVASSLIFCGCGTNSTTMSKQEIDNFHGGPMPASAAATIAKRQADMQKSEPASYKAWLANRAAALSKKRAPAQAAPAAHPTANGQ